jgi:chromosomal replication initiator protein
LDDLLKTQSIWHAALDILKSDPRITPPMLGFLELAEAKGIISETLYLEVPNDLARGIL